MVDPSFLLSIGSIGPLVSFFSARRHLRRRRSTTFASVVPIASLNAGGFFTARALAPFPTAVVRSPTSGGARARQDPAVAAVVPRDRAGATIALQQRQRAGDEPRADDGARRIAQQRKWSTT